MPNRRAYTLIEALLVISLMTLVLATIATLFQSVMRANRGVQEHRGAMTSIQRLASQLREDIHAADSATTADDRLSIQQPQGETVTYTAADETINRTVESNGQVTHRDTFDLLPAATAKFETDRTADRVVSLLVNYPLDASQPEFSDHRTLRIDATISRSHAPHGSALPRRGASPIPE
jgi:type II secretory pathway component PulJ